MENITQYYNLLEAFIWFAIAGFCWLRWAKTNIEKKYLTMLVIAFLAFGVSDLVEIRTGSWWRPWWLLVWKAGCLLVIGFCVKKLYRKLK